MSSVNSLSEAIKNRNSINFSYPKPGKILGNRVGNPHAVYKFTSKDGIISTKVHIWQTGGVSDIGEPIPGWRNFNLEYINGVELILGASPFPIAEGYNPDYYDEDGRSAIVII